MASTERISDTVPPLIPVKKKPGTKANGATGHQPPPESPETAAALAGEAGDDDIAIPEIRTASPDKDDPDFWAWLSQWPAEEWDYLICYLWRCAPVIDTTAGGRPTQLAVIGHRFDPDFIMKQYGSGRYRADISRIPKSGAKQTRIRQAYFTIHNTDYPPRVPPGDWVSDARNKNWIWGVQAATGMVAGPGGTQVNLNELLQTSVEAIRGKNSDNGELTGAIIKMIGDNNDAIARLTNPATQIQTMRELLTLIPQKSEGESSASRMMFDFMSKMLDNQAAEIRALRDNQQKQPTLREKLEEIKEAMSLMGRGPKVESNPGTDWGQVALQAIEKIAPVIPGLVFALTRDKNQPAPNPAGPNAQTFRAGPTQPSAAAPQLTPAPQPAAAAAPREPLPEGVTPELIQEEQERLITLYNKHGELINEMMPFMVDHFQNLTGYDFRDFFISRKGLQLWNTFRDDAGGKDAPARIMALVQLNAEAAKRLSPPEKLTAFLTAFFTPQGDEPESMRDEEEEE